MKSKGSSGVEVVMSGAILLNVLFELVQFVMEVFVILACIKYLTQK